MGVLTVAVLLLGLITPLALRNMLPAVFHQRIRTAPETALCPQKTFGLSPSHHDPVCPLPSVEQSPFQRPQLWTHRPSCAGSLKETDAQYCVFTNTFFGSHGISLVASPETASNAASALARIYDSSYPSLTTVRNLNTTPAYEVVTIPGKGRAVRATRRIRQKETFIVDFASLVVISGLNESVSQTGSGQLLHRAVTQLVNPESILSLRGNGVEDILQINAFNCFLNGQLHHAVFPNISLINHSCKPNAFLRFSLPSFTAGVAPVRDIEPGEEITISYLPFGWTSNERQKFLERWRFHCTCELCSASPEDRVASDQRRAKVGNVKYEIFSHLQNSNYRGAIDVIRKALGLLEQESLVWLYAQMFESMARIYLVMGDEENAEKYMHMALDNLDDYAHLAPKDRAVEFAKMMDRF